MKRATAFLLMLILSLSLAACGAPESDFTAEGGIPREDGAILPPQRATEEVLKFKDKQAFLPEDLSSFDLIAIVTVGNWLGEDRGTGVTHYSAAVDEIYRGETGETVTLLHRGTSKKTVEGHPLPVCGDQLLVFCRKASAPDPENAYEIDLTVLCDLYRKGAMVYVNDRDHQCFSKTEAEDLGETDIDLRREFQAELNARDPERESLGIPCRTIYDIDDLIPFLIETKEE